MSSDNARYVCQPDTLIIPHFQTKVKYVSTLWSHSQGRFFLPTLKHWDSKTDNSLEIPREAAETEPIVALLQADLLESLGHSGESDGIFQDHSASLPVNLTDEQLEVMRGKLRALLQQWQDLQPGESMTLQFKM